LKGWLRGYGIGSATVEEIDAHNILRASHIAMLRAMEELKSRIPPPIGNWVTVVDGNQLPFEWRGKSECRALVKGDLKMPSIAAASILAKVARDRVLDELGARHPGYGFESHAGYPTPAHQEALVRLGVTPAHRRTFGPVRRALEH